MTKKAERIYFPESIKPVVVPLFSMSSENGTFCPAGSGVLLSYSGRTFLCTAAHVVARTSEHSIWVGREPFAIQSPFLRNRLGEKDTVESDPIDFAAVELTPEQTKKLSEKFSFHELCITRIDRQAQHSSRYQIVGYLQDHNTVNEGTFAANALRVEIESERIMLQHDPARKGNEDRYIAGTLDPADQRWRLNPALKGLRDYSGMSGGAWLYEEPYSAGEYKRLAGLSLEVKPYKRGKVKFVGLGVRAITDMLHCWFPSLPRPSWK